MAAEGRAPARPTPADPLGDGESRRVRAPASAGVGLTMPTRSDGGLDTWAVQSDADDHLTDDAPAFDVAWTGRHTRP